MTKETFDSALTALAIADAKGAGATNTFAPLAVARLASGAMTVQGVIDAACNAAAVRSTKGKLNAAALRDAGMTSLYSIVQGLGYVFDIQKKTGVSRFDEFETVRAITDAYLGAIPDSARQAYRDGARADKAINKALSALRTAQNDGDTVAQKRAGAALRKAIAAYRAAFIDALYNDRPATWNGYLKAVKAAVGKARGEGEGEGAGEGEGEGDGDGESPAPSETGIASAIQSLVERIDGLTAEGAAKAGAHLADLLAAIQRAQSKAAALIDTLPDMAEAA